MYGIVYPTVNVYSVVFFIQIIDKELFYYPIKILLHQCPRFDQSRNGGSWAGHECIDRSENCGSRFRKSKTQKLWNDDRNERLEKNCWKVRILSLTWVRSNKFQREYCKFNLNIHGQCQNRHFLRQRNCCIF